MKVSSLIEELQKCDPDADVIVCYEHTSARIACAREEFISTFNLHGVETGEFSQVLICADNFDPRIDEETMKLLPDFMKD